MHEGEIKKKKKKKCSLFSTLNKTISHTHASTCSKLAQALDLYNKTRAKPSAITQTRLSNTPHRKPWKNTNIHLEKSKAFRNHFSKIPHALHKQNQILTKQEKPYGAWQCALKISSTSMPHREPTKAIHNTTHQPPHNHSQESINNSSRMKHIHAIKDKECECGSNATMEEHPKGNMQAQ